MIRTTQLASVALPNAAGTTTVYTVPVGFHVRLWGVVVLLSGGATQVVVYAVANAGHWLLNQTPAAYPAIVTPTERILPVTLEEGDTVGVVLSAAGTGRTILLSGTEYSN